MVERVLDLLAAVATIAWFLIDSWHRFKAYQRQRRNKPNGVKKKQPVGPNYRLNQSSAARPTSLFYHLPFTVARYAWHFADRLNNSTGLSNP